MVRPYPPGPAPAGPLRAPAIPVSPRGLVEYPGPASTGVFLNAVDTSRWLIPAGLIAVDRGSVFMPDRDVTYLLLVIPPPDLIVTIASSFLHLRRRPGTRSRPFGPLRGSAHIGSFELTPRWLRYRLRLGPQLSLSLSFHLPLLLGQRRVHCCCCFRTHLRFLRAASRSAICLNGITFPLHKSFASLIPAAIPLLMVALHWAAPSSRHKPQIFAELSNNNTTTSGLITPSKIISPNLHAAQ